MLSNCSGSSTAESVAEMRLRSGVSGCVIFQDAVQNHYLSFGYASPMCFDISAQSAPK